MMENRNPKQQQVTRITRLLINIVVLVHLMFFLLEALLWMNPFVYTPLLDLLHNPVSSEYPLQALTLRNLFINQGFYNLFVAIAGIIGQALIRNGRSQAGFALVLFMCFAGIGAGITLAFSTIAYILAAAQTLPAFAAFIRIYPAFKTSD